MRIDIHKKVWKEWQQMQDEMEGQKRMEKALSYDDQTCGNVSG
jgi:hypothetical protein